MPIKLAFAAVIEPVPTGSIGATVLMAEQNTHFAWVGDAAVFDEGWIVHGRVVEPLTARDDIRR